MSRRDVARVEYPPPPPSKCAKVLYYTWRLCSVVFSHFVMISLVVAYCILGAVTFEKLEADYEREVKRNISHIRNNTSFHIWSMTNRSVVLHPENWTTNVVHILKDFENSILLEMKVRGWDGNEDTERLQWTFTGALFYSIIVITTIGYGHIAPKTQSGKVVTIFYAILGIPLMLLTLSNIGDVMASSFRSAFAFFFKAVTIFYAILGIPLMLLTLSNIGDVMASSFRFLYWRVCCYVCTRPPKRRHRHHHSTRRSVRGNSTRGSTRRKRPQLERTHSDTDCRYRDSGYSSAHMRRSRPISQSQTLPARTRSQPPHLRGHNQKANEEERPSAQYEKYGRDTFRENFEEELPEFPKISLPLQDLEAALKDLDEHQVKVSQQNLRSKSLPRPAKSKPDYGPRREFDDYRHFEDDAKDFFEMHDLNDVDYENYKEKRAREFEDKGRRPGDDREDFYGYKDRGYDPEDDDFEFDGPKTRRSWHDRDQRYHRGRSEYYERDREEYPERRGRRARSAIYDNERRWEDDHEEFRRDRDPEAGRHRRLRRLQTVDETTRAPYRYTPSPDRDDWSDDVVVSRKVRPQGWEVHSVPPEPSKEDIKPVPIWLCVFLVASYIVAGTFLFKSWEGWAYLDAAYFCFITLTTIGFGDFVPAQGQSHVANGNAADAVHSIALCSLYLLFGIALLAMSFNLVQEEVRANVASLATKLGIIKPKQVDSESEE